MTERDARDTVRRAAPLAAPPDAHIIDTTALDADAVFERASGLGQRMRSPTGADGAARTFPPQDRADAAAPDFAGGRAFPRYDPGGAALCSRGIEEKEWL